LWHSFITQPAHQTGQHSAATASKNGRICGTSSNTRIISVHTALFDYNKCQNKNNSEVAPELNNSEFAPQKTEQKWDCPKNCTKVMSRKLNKSGVAKRTEQKSGSSRNRTRVRLPKKLNKSDVQKIEQK
jgi:hypothetical protein